MWAQLITARLKPGRESDLAELVEALQASEQPGSGLVRSTMMRDENDASRLHVLVVFETQEKARARENDERRKEPLGKVRTLMGESFDGPPEFADLAVVEEWTP